MSLQMDRLRPLRTWCEAKGINYSTALKRAQYGQMDGRDEFHPQISQDSHGRWWVAPNGYARMATNPEADAVTVRELVRTEVAAVLRELLGVLEASS